MVEVHFVSGSGGIGTRLYNIIKALGGSGGVLVSEGVLIWVATAAAEYDLSFNCAVLNRSRLVFQAILADGRVSGRACTCRRTAPVHRLLLLPGTVHSR